MADAGAAPTGHRRGSWARGGRRSATTARPSPPSFLVLVLVLALGLTVGVLASACGGSDGGGTGTGTGSGGTSVRSGSGRDDADSSAPGEGATEGCPDWPVCETGTDMRSSSDGANGPATDPSDPTRPPSELALRPVLAVRPDPDGSRCSGEGDARSSGASSSEGGDRSSTELNGAGSSGDEGEGVVIASACDGGSALVYELGPVALSGSAFASASASPMQGTGDWVVSLVLKDGDGGVGAFNAIAAQCFAGSSACPTRQLAIVVDGHVVSAPFIQQPSFEADAVQVSGGFDEASASALAADIRSAGSHQ